MVEEVEEPKIPLKYSVSRTCPNCKAVVEFEVDWGTSADMELALCPIACSKCGVRID